MVRAYRNLRRIRLVLLSCTYQTRPWRHAAAHSAVSGFVQQRRIALRVAASLRWANEALDVAKLGAFPNARRVTDMRAA